MGKITGWIIYPRAKCSMTDASYEWIVEQASIEGIELEVLFIEDLSPVTSNDGLQLLNCGIQISRKPHFAIVRGYDFTIMNHIELMGIKLFNGCGAMYKSLDKYLTCQILASRGILIPKTISNCRDYQMIKTELNSGRFILKYPKGSRGDEVYLVENQEQFNEINNKYQEIISQEFIESSMGRDIRVWVIGDKAVDAVMRYNCDSFKSNYSQGGAVTRVEITPEIERIAVESSQAIGLDFSGIDLLFGQDGQYFVCEVNGNAAFRSLATLQDNVDIPRKLFRYIYSRPLKKG